MELNRKDRYIIANQLKILEALYPDEAGSYAIQRTAFEEGYESHYSWAMEHISTDTLAKVDAEEVIDTLDMFSAIQQSYKALSDKDKGDIDEYCLKFRGYDGNNQIECKLLGYARYFVVELDRFQELLKDRNDHFDFNSHGEMRDVYKRMLEKWKKFPAGIEEGRKHNLTKEQLKALEEATVHPKNRV